MASRFFMMVILLVVSASVSAQDALARKASAWNAGPVPVNVPFASLPRELVRSLVIPPMEERVYYEYSVVMDGEAVEYLSIGFNAEDFSEETCRIGSDVVMVMDNGIVSGFGYTLFCGTREEVARQIAEEVQKLEQYFGAENVTKSADLSEVRIRENLAKSIMLSVYDYPGGQKIVYYVKDYDAARAYLRAIK